MSTPAGPHARTRLALALAAAAAASGPAAAAAAPVPAVRESGSPASPGKAPARPATPQTPAPPAVPVSVRYAAAADSASWASHTVAARAPAASGDDTIAYHPDAVSDLELLKVAAAAGGARLGVVTSHPGLLHVEWRGGGHRGTIREPVRAGHSQVSLRGLPGTTHLKVRATLIPDGDYASSGASGAFKLRHR